jgi:hypothetical protein
MAWKSTPDNTKQSGDDVRDQNLDPGSVPAVNWDGSSKGKVPLLGTDRDPTQVA